MYEIAFFNRSKIARLILTHLDSPKTAVILKKELNKHREAISRSLLQLETKGYVKCENPNDKNYRYYKITKKGKEILEKLKMN